MQCVMFLLCIISQVLTPVEQSSSASTTLRQRDTERERAVALENGALPTRCWLIAGDNLRFWYFLFPVSVDLGPLEPFALTDFGAGSRSSFQQSDSLMPEVMLKPK